MVPTGVANAQATGAGTTSVPGIIAGLNLNSTSLPSTSAFNPVDPTTYNNSTSTTTYDSKGVAQITTMYFAKASSLDTTVTPPAEPSVPASGIVTDPTTGITTVTPTNPITNLTVGGCNTRRKLPDRNDDYGRHGSVSGYRSAHLHIIYDLGRPFRYAYYGLNLGNDVPNT
ncbi:MAG: flagellar basal body FlgE domain-containing protein [Nitrosomonadales bacterium]